MLKAIIVDDEELAVLRLRDMLGNYNEIEICHTFTNPFDAYLYVKTHSVDLAFLDISMPQIRGMQLSSLLLQINAAMDIVLVTGYDNYAVQAFDMSALDYLMKPVTESRIAKTLEKIRKGSPNLVAPPDSDAVQTDQGKLTEQEKRILRFISDGLSNREIAVQLDISVETVKYHVKNLYKKFQVNNRVQVVVRARKSGILV